MRERGLVPRNRQRVGSCPVVAVGEGAKMTAAVGDARRAEVLSRPRVLLGASLGHNRQGEAERLRRDLEAGGFEVVGSAGTTPELVDAVSALRPDVVLLTPSMRGNVLAAVADLRRLPARPDVVVLGDPANGSEFLAVVAAGAVGYLPADLLPCALARALRGVVAGEAAIPRHLERQLVEAYRSRFDHQMSVPGLDRPADLSEREWEVLQLLWQGRSTRQIADRLYVSTGTVRSHISSLVEKLGVESREELRRLLYARPLLQ